MQADILTSEEYGIWGCPGKGMEGEGRGGGEKGAQTSAVEANWEGFSWM